MDAILSKTPELASKNPDIVIVWLYGSRARGNHHPASDYDLAVAFANFIKDDPVEKRLRPECLALDWQQALGLGDFQLSVVDINQAPIPLAWEIIQADTVLFCRDDNRGGKHCASIAGWNWIIRAGLKRKINADHFAGSSL